MILTLSQPDLGPKSLHRLSADNKICHYERKRESERESAVFLTNG